jgi:hypothetical protein
MQFFSSNILFPTQVTFQARDLKERRYLYDQLAVLCPLFLALTAGCPVFKAKLADTDARWNALVRLFLFGVIFEYAPWVVVFPYSSLRSVGVIIGVSLCHPNGDI